MKTILDLIGNTPLVPINRLNPLKDVTIYAKLEAFNPAGSVKERIALSMIEAAEKSGELTPDKTVLEATSGNTGIGIAMVCAVKGYRCQLVMPESASIERRKIMTAFGAEILLTPAKKSTDGAIEQAYAMARQHPELYFLTDQFNNEANWKAHYVNTGPEIWSQTDGLVTDVVATMGTTGTVMGLSNYFADNHPEVHVIAMEPFYKHKIQGLKNMKESYCPGIFDKNKPFKIVNVADEDAFDMARQLARQEGIFVGMSSGAAMCAALARAKEIAKGVIVVIFPDGGEKYLSTILFSAPQVVEEEGKSNLRLYNTVSRKKEVFEPLHKKRVTFYSCGPTAYEHASLDHCRRFVFGDLVYRLLTVKGFDVHYYMNFTDLDDNTIKGAALADMPLDEYTQGYINEFLSDIDQLGVRKAKDYPKASDHVGAMIELSSQLIKKGYAYEKHGSVYFDISKFRGYGKLSRVDISKVRSGQTVDLDDYEKESPVDFTLLKRSTLSELKKGIFFESEFGNVRPGWHVECAAMTLHYLGDTMDIHTSSSNLIFPHHENENAIAQAMTGKPLAKYWIHNELVLVDGKKMSVANKNLITLRELIDEGYTARDVRFFLLSTHYRKTISFSKRKLDTAKKNLCRLDEFTCKLKCLPLGLPHPQVAAHLSQMEDGFFEALDDDFNISKAMASLFDFIKKMNPILNTGNLDQEQKEYILESLAKINEVLNVLRLEECPLAPEISKLISERERARHNKDWEKADTVRAELVKHGIDVIDTACGHFWKEVTKKK
nr:cysteine--tRNA ligase [Desulfobulbaceae bacterium]